MNTTTGTTDTGQRVRPIRTMGPRLAMLTIRVIMTVMQRPVTADTAGVTTMLP